MPLNVQCKRCANLRNEWCGKKHDSPDLELVRDCQYYRTKTNADRIRAKSDEELATWVETIAGCDLCPMLDEQCSGGEVNSRASCKHHWLEWLRQEA